MKYQTEPYYCSQNINKLTPKPIISVWNRYVANYFVANIQKFVEQYNHQQGGYKLEDIKSHKIYLPIKDGEIDFELIVSYIKEIETEQFGGLLTFLKDNNLQESNLSEDEKLLVKKLDFDEINTVLSSVAWEEFRIGDLFDRIETKKLPYKAKGLPTEPQGDCVLPCLTSSFKNQGLNYYAPTKDATILQNVISLPSNSDVYRAYYQPHDFTVLSDSYAIKWIYNDCEMDSDLYLFCVTCINKVTDLPIYSYKNKLGGWQTVKDKKILLPVKDNKIDLEFMANVIRLIKKLLVKGIVEYMCE